MKTCLPLLSLLAMLSLSSFSIPPGLIDWLRVAQRNAAQRNAARPIAFNGQTYQLALSTQPTNGYVRQEYMPATETASTYQNLFMVSVLTTGITVDEAVAMQVRKLEAIQQEDLTVNYRIRRDSATNTALLDFVWRAYSDDSNPLVEWNAYRFEPYTSPTGQKGVLMLGNRRRAYGAAIVPFLTAFRAERPRVLDSLSTYKMPVTQIVVQP